MYFIIDGPPSVIEEMDEMAEELQELEDFSIKCNVAVPMNKRVKKSDLLHFRRNFIYASLAAADLLIIHDKRIIGDEEVEEGHMTADVLDSLETALQTGVRTILTHKPSSEELGPLPDYHPFVTKIEKDSIAKRLKGLDNPWNLNGLFERL